MLKQKARAIALGVLIWDLVLTALSLPVAYVLRLVRAAAVFPADLPDPALSHQGIRSSSSS